MHSLLLSTLKIVKKPPHSAFGSSINLKDVSSSGQLPSFEVSFLGATLICVFGGLRFADSQRLPLRSLILDASSLRGVCDRTKTSHHGQPWGLLISGLLSLGSFTWVSKYLMVLDELWHHSGLESIDYLFFQFVRWFHLPHELQRSLEKHYGITSIAPGNRNNHPGSQVSTSRCTR